LGVEVITSAREYRAYRARVEGECVLVPTMGALHAGHASLVALGAKLARDERLRAGCVVTIFVNPTQFNDPADLERYPRTLDADLVLCRRAGAACVYAPGVADVYPDGPAAAAVPAVGREPGLEDAHRPGHFAGVVQVVRRLFEMTRPVAAVFGEKDWQQLQVIRAMAAADGGTVRIIPGETVREPDGLAMSSRNRFLSPADRARAVAINRALREAAVEPTPEEAESAMGRVLAADGIRADYAVVRDAETLMGPGGPGVAVRSWRALIAARVGEVRLLDNGPWAPPTVG
jgi:pantoate--beta-alanine ligase